MVKNLAKLYIGSCDIYEYESFVDEKSHITRQRAIVKYENIPCRASYYNNSSNILVSKENKFNNIINQKVKIFLQNNIDIKAGSIIIVTQNGKTTKYKNSGESVLYSNHQEIMVEIFNDLA